MQVIAQFTRKELENQNDPLDLACHAISKLKFIGNIIMNGSCNLKSEPLEDYSRGDIYAMGEIVFWSTEELQKLIEITQEKDRAIVLENRALKERIKEPEQAQAE
jgi:hypothetical protein